MGFRIEQCVAEIGHEASGPSYSVPRLAQALSDRGNDVSLHVLDTGVRRSIPGVRVHAYRSFGPRGVFPPAMLTGIHAAARRAHIVHGHGLWMSPNVLSSLAVVGTAAKLVVSPRGVFASAAMGRSPLTKRLAWALGQGWAVRRAKLLHATSSAEAEDIRRIGLRAPIAVIPNGVDLVALPQGRVRPPGERTLLFLGRIHPIKGVDRLLRVWNDVSPLFPSWRLVLVGPDENDHEAELRRLATELRLQRTEFRGALYGDDKARAYADADAFVLPTLTENFGMSVAEALAAALPVVVTRGAPWAGVERERCGRWVDHDDEAIGRALREILSLSDEERAAMGERGRAWVERDFSWSGVAAKMERAYAWLWGHEPMPDFVVSAP